MHIDQTSDAGIVRSLPKGRLGEAVVAHWRRLLSEGSDAEHVARVTRIGIMHREHGVRLGLYVLAYGRFTDHFVSAIGGDRSIPAEERLPLISAVVALAFTDMALVVASYDAALVD